MSDRLQQGLATSRTEIEAGLDEAEAELARMRQLCRETEELIANAKAVLLSAYEAKPVRGGETARRGVSAFERTGGEPTPESPTAPDLAAGLRARLQEQAHRERDPETEP
jgi:hypothetical protein